jgi:hypothetical protein
MELREGKPIIYVPICKHPRDFIFAFGPLGYERVEKVTECPILVRTDRRKPERAGQPA